MPDFEKLRIPEGQPFTMEKWGELLDEIEELALTIPTNTNGEVLNSVAVGTKPENDSVLNYPWEYESIGVAKTNHNLRLQSPGSVYIHTNIGGNLEENRTKIPFTIHKNDRVGIGLNYPEEPQAKLQIINANQDANGDTLVLGKTDGKTSNLRLGYHQDYSWIQSHGSKPLSINPLDNNVGIRTFTPESPLHVNGVIQSSNGGFKFPDNKIQSRASEVLVMKAGVTALNHTGHWKTSPLYANKEYVTPPITLIGFTEKPTVFHGITHLDARGDKNTRIAVYVHDINKVSANRFQLRFKFTTWADSQVYGCAVNWIALGK